jgi:deoxycytidylate deaminase
LIKYLKLAEKEANKSKEKFKLGCILIKNGIVIGKGCNTNKSHPKYGSGFHSFLHAEGRSIWDAISNNKNVENSTAYVFRRNNLMSKPCLDCQKLLKRFKVKEVVYIHNNKLRKEQVNSL